MDRLTRNVALTTDSTPTDSPFPGMDPYTEARHLWKGIHTQLIGELSTHVLPPLLAPAYVVDVEPSLQVRSESAQDERGHSERGVYPDLQVLTSQSGPTPKPAGLGLPVAEATATVTVSPTEDAEDEESAIFVRAADTEQLVTVIEILSYSNKTSEQEKRARYLLKRWELLNSGVHLVEVDLLRWGQRVVFTLPAQPYHILVSRADDPMHSRVWSFGFDAPIPDTPLPLIGADEHVPLPLQAAYTAIYRARRFRTRLDYHADLDLPLTAEQQMAIQHLLRDAAVR